MSRDSRVNMISSTLKLHTNAHTVRGRPTLKDVERFRNGSNLLRGREHFIVNNLSRTTYREPFIENNLSIYTNSETTYKSYPNLDCIKRTQVLDFHTDMLIKKEKQQLKAKA